jgi:hypothetical protein
VQQLVVGEVVVARRQDLRVDDVALVPAAPTPWGSTPNAQPTEVGKHAHRPTVQ